MKIGHGSLQYSTSLLQGSLHCTGVLGACCLPKTQSGADEAELEADLAPVSLLSHSQKLYLLKGKCEFRENHSANYFCSNRDCYA